MQPEIQLWTGTYLLQLDFKMEFGQKIQTHNIQRLERH